MSTSHLLFAATFLTATLVWLVMKRAEEKRLINENESMFWQVVLTWSFLLAYQLYANLCTGTAPFANLP